MVCDFADEFVIGVDQGSTDNTLAIAEKWVRLKGKGKVVRFKWEMDFSKARNHVRDQITTDWWMTVDGHEYIEGNSLRNLLDVWNVLKKLEQPDEDGKIKNIVAFAFNIQLEDIDGYTRAFQFRLMRNFPEV